MKIRSGFVSNSSSTSFVIDMTEMPEELKKKIMRMTNRTHDCSRCTGIICNISEWNKELDGFYDYLVEDYGDKSNVIMIRESDEQMGGSFDDYGFNWGDIRPYVLHQFEFH